MKIPPDAIIPPDKLTGYLLRFRTRNDKSRLLSRLGFAIDAPQVLESAIRAHAAQGEASMDSRNEYAEYFVLHGDLVGPQGVLPITSVWICRTGEDAIRFVTLKPRQEPR